MIINAIKDGVGITGGGSGAKPPVLEELNVTENGTYTPSDGVDGFNPVEVNVQPNLQSKSVEITANGQSTVVADSSFDGIESLDINVNVPIPTFQTEELSVASNGTYTPSTDGYSKVSVNVQPKLQAKSQTTTITENGTSTITLEPDSNYDGLSSASVTITTNVASSGGGSTPTIYIKDGTKLKLADNNGEVSDLSCISPIGLTTMYEMFNYSTTTGIVNIDGWDTSNVTNMRDTFSDCQSLTSLDISGWNTSKVTNMYNMFSNCYMLTSLDISGWNTSKVTNMSYMFRYCYKLASLDISGWDTSNLTNLSEMFYCCESLVSLDLSGWNTSNVASSMDSMFQNCTALTSLNLGGWDVSKVTNMSYMFFNCKNLASLNISGWNASKVTNMYYMFRNCNSLPSLDLSNWGVSNVTNMQDLFSNCKSLVSLDLSGWNMSNITNYGDVSNMFGLCTSLTDLNMNGAILPKINLTIWNLSDCPLTVDSLVSVLNALPQLDEGQSYTCTIGSTNLNKLSDTQKAIATNKGWTLN